jgi:uncharacterized protein YwqG
VSDFVAFVGTWEQMSAALGTERIAAFRASMEGSPRKIPRLGQVKSRESIERFAAAKGLPARAGTIAASCRWAVELVPAGADKRPRSHLGGLPAMPYGIDWPTWNSRPLSFLATIALEEIPTGDFAGCEQAVPREGTLLFFADLIDWTGEPEPNQPGAPIRVIFIPKGAEVSRRELPTERFHSSSEERVTSLTALREKAVSHRSRLTMPSEMPGLDYFQRIVYREIFEKVSRSQGRARIRGQLFGHPTDTMQDDPRERGQDLLLQLRADRDTGFMFADGGDLYFLLTEQFANEPDWKHIVAVGASG